MHVSLSYVGFCKQLTLPILLESDDAVWVVWWNCKKYPCWPASIVQLSGELSNMMWPCQGWTTSNYSSLIVLLAKYCRDCCADSCPCKSAATGILTGRGDCWGFPARSECSSSESGASLIKEKLSGGVCYQGLLYIGLFLSPFSFPLHWQSWQRAMGMFPGRANNPLKWEWCEVCGTLQPVQKEGVKAEMKSSFCGFLLTGRCLCFVHAKL